jgi:hypothetical protein
MKTDFETLKALASYTVNYLKEHEIIDFKIDKRLELIDALATEFGVGLATDEDIKDQAIEEVEEKMGLTSIPDDITESEMFNHARKEIVRSFNGENISGLYLVESLNQIGVRIKEFLLNSDLVEDVFGTDEDIVAFLVKRIRQFSVARG